MRASGLGKTRPVAHNRGMGDEDGTDQQKPEEPAAGGAVPEPPPPLYQFSEAQLLKWIAVPEDAIIPAPIRKRDVDNLMLGLFRLADAQTLWTQPWFFGPTANLRRRTKISHGSGI
jgi:hypothetical protein